jgi:hypothetical protein
MKNESVKIIADLMLSAEVPQFAKEKLVQIMRIETLGTKVKGFKMTDYVDSKSKGYRPALEGVFYDESGYEVATEGHILIYRKVDVPDNFKNRIVLPNGEFVPEDTLYPKWKAVVPNDAEFEPFIVNFDKVEEFAKDWKAKKKICGKVVPMITFKNRYFNLDLFVKFIKAMKYAETNIIKLNPKNDTTPVSFGSYDNMGGLIMPMLPPTANKMDDYEIYTL